MKQGAPSVSIMFIMLYLLKCFFVNMCKKSKERMQTSPTIPELFAKFAEIYAFAQQHGVHKSNPKLCDDMQMIRGHFLKTESILRRVRSKWKTEEDTCNVK
jgi:hypothetical protein